MGMKSRSKGKVGEREIAAIVRDLTGWEVRRKVRQLDGESDLEGVPAFSVEVKRHASATRGDIRCWWDQANAQAVAEGKVPVLFFRRDRDEWRAVWPMSLECAAAGRGYEWTIEGSVETWAAAAREFVSTSALETETI
jgi:hypothetical protein